jgi:UDP-N-acetylmuramoyl-L-alanyl-D-glutamate--2,6-diaminopimelate ligase
MDVWSVSIQGPARLQAKDIGLGDEGLSFTVLEAGHSLRMNTRLVGQYNVSNLLGCWPPCAAWA